MLSSSGYRPPTASDAVAQAAEAVVVDLVWKGQSVQARRNEFILSVDPKSAADPLAAVKRSVSKRRGDVAVVKSLDSNEKTFLIDAPTGVEAAKLTKSLRSIKGFRYLEPNFVYHVDATPDDPSFGLQYGLNNTGQSGGTADADIDAPEAWELAQGDGSVVVGVIDTGVDYNHPDLAANIWTNPGEIPGNDIDDDHNGFIDDIHGWDFIGDGDNDPIDEQGHGTHVAGIIAAEGNNGVGVSGVNWNAKIMALRFLDAGGLGDGADAIEALHYATMMRQRGVNIRLTNNSWAGGAFSQAMQDAIAASGQAGMLFMAAAGNAGVNTDVSPNYPSCYDVPNVIAVAATDRNDALASFSNYGATTVDLGAPGVDVLSTVPSGEQEYATPSGYRTLSGTSMATPMVSGVAGLGWSLAPDASVEQMRDALLNGGDVVTSLAGKTVTGRRLNALGTLKKLGLRVAGVTPAAGSVVASRPTDFTVRFTLPIVADATSPAGLQSSDFRVNGVAADAVTLTGPRSAVFHFNASPVTSEGRQTMSMSAAAVRSADEGTPLTPYTAEFRYDTITLGPVAVEPAPGAIVPAPGFSLRLRFNERYDRATVGLDDLQLSQGRVAAVRPVDDFTVEYTLADVLNEGPLTIRLAAGALADTFGNPGAAYSADYTVDRGTIAYPSPFDSVEPKAIWAYDSEPVKGIVGTPADLDRYTLNLTAGQAVGVAIDSSETLRSSIALVDADGHVVQSAVAVAAGKGATFVARAAAGGTYFLVVRGADATTGGYSLRVTLNIADEREQHGGEKNDFASTADNLDPLFTTLAPSVRRAAALGRATNEDDHFSFTAVAGENIGIYAQKRAGGGNVDALELSNGATLQAVSVAEADGRSIQRFTVPITGRYFVHVHGDGSGAQYVLAVVSGAALDQEPNDSAPFAQPLAGGRAVLGSVSAGGGPLPTEIEPNDDGRPAVTLGDLRLANDLTGNFNPDDLPSYTASVNGTISAGDDADLDFYRFYARPGDQLGVTMNRIAGQGDLDPYLRVYDRAGALIGFNDDGGDGNNSALNVAAFTYAGEYYIAADGFGFSAGGYTLTATLTTPVLTTSTDADVYSVNLPKGALATFASATPNATALDERNDLDPILEILDSTGEKVLATDDNGVGDGRNARLTFLAAKAGIYLVRISAKAGTEGGYLLSALGAAETGRAFTVVGTTPTNNSVAGPIRQVTVRFSQPVAAATLDPSDLTIDGVPATAVKLLDGTTAQFTIAQPTAGAHLMAVAEGAATDLQNQPLEGFRSLFIVDDAGPRIIASSIAEGQGVAAGTLVYTATFDEPLRSSVGSGDVELAGVASGTRNPNDFDYDAKTRTLTLEFDDLPEDIYTLTLISGAGRFEDAVGNALDGEANWPLPEDGSGDGQAGGDFVVHFTTDAPARPISDWNVRQPTGSVVYDASAAALIGTTTDFDDFTFSLRKGQFVSVTDLPAGALQARLQLLDPQNKVVATSVASAPGETILLQGAPVATAGVYRLRVSSIGATRGPIALNLALNAQVETESIRPPLNDTPPAAQSIDGAFTTLTGGVDRAAVEGSLPTDARRTVLREGFEGFNLGPQWTTAGSARLVGAPSPAEGNQSLLMAASGDSRLNEATWTVDLTGVAHPLLNFSHSVLDDTPDAFSGPFEGHFNADGVAISGDGVHWTPVWSAPDQPRGVWQTYALDLELSARQAGISLGPNVRIRFQQYAKSSGARGWDDARITTPAAAYDWYSVNLAAGQAAALVVGATSGAARLALFDASGAQVAQGAGPRDNAADAIDNFVAPRAGRYDVRVSGTAASYVLTAVKNAAFDLEPNDGAASPQKLGDRAAALGYLGVATPPTSSMAGPPASVAAAISLPLDLFDGAGYRWDIQGNGGVLDGTDDAYDGGLIHVNFPSGSAAQSEDGGREVAVGPATVSGVRVTRKIYVPQNRAFARYLEIVTNPSEAAVDYTVRIGSNLGSDDKTTIVGTSSGDTSFTPADQWVVTDDAEDGGGDPTLLHIIGGEGAENPASYASAFSGELEYDYTLTLAPGQTKIIMHFASQNPDRATALAAAPRLAALGDGALSGMSTAELSQVTNFNLTNTTDAYSRTFTAGETVTLQTFTPGDGLGGGAGDLDPKLEVRDSAGNVLAEDDNSAADRRNAQLVFTPPAAGTYRIVVSSAGSAGGEYVVRLTPGATITSAPRAPTLAAATDSGVSASDGVTNFNNASPDRAPRFNVSGVTPGATVTLYADGAPIGSAVATGDTVTIAADGRTALADGAHAVTARQTPAGRPESADSNAGSVVVDTTAPRVVGTYVRGSSWSAVFLDHLRAVGLGLEGFTVKGQGTLPWTDVDQVLTRFSEDVRTSAADLQTAGTAAGVAVASFAYDNVTKVAMWRFAKALGRGEATFLLSGVTDLAGNTLAVDASRTTLRLLPGDTDRDGRVTAADLVQVRNRIGSSAKRPGSGAGAYSVFSDFNADGVVNAVDLVTARGAVGQSLAASLSAQRFLVRNQA